MLKWDKNDRTSNKYKNLQKKLYKKAPLALRIFFTFLRSLVIFWPIVTCNVAIESYRYVKYTCFVHTNHQPEVFLSRVRSPLLPHVVGCGFSKVQPARGSFVQLVRRCVNPTDALADPGRRAALITSQVEVDAQSERVEGRLLSVSLTLFNLRIKWLSYFDQSCSAFQRQRSQQIPCTLIMVSNESLLTP